MKLFQCDICGQETERDGLWNIEECYSPTGIEHTCRGCATRLQEKISEVKAKYDDLKAKEIQTYILAEIRDYKTESA